MTARFEPTSEHDLIAAIRRAARQEQFLEVVSAEAARARIARHVDQSPLPGETVMLAAALGRVLARDVIAPIDVPPFDRANVDGFALRSADTTGASDTAPRRFGLNGEVIMCGHAPALEVLPGSATAIATGGVIPRGADARERADAGGGEGRGEAPAIDLRRAAAPGQLLSYAGSDIARGEVVLRRKTRIFSREIGMLAACGIAVVEAGGEPVPFGAFPDDEVALELAMRTALQTCDIVVLSGGTSKGAGDLSARIVSKLGEPGILVHGVALKPGKPLCLAVIEGKPLTVLPGFPTSAIFTFHAFVAPVIRARAALPPEAART